MFRDESPGSPGSDDAARARVADPLRSSPGEEVDHVASTAQRDLADVDERRGDAVIEQLDALAAA
jgi:hypothetical protein